MEFPFVTYLHRKYSVPTIQNIFCVTVHKYVAVDVWNISWFSAVFNKILCAFVRRYEDEDAIFNFLCIYVAIFVYYQSTYNLYLTQPDLI